MTREELRTALLIRRIKDNCYEVSEYLIKEHNKQIIAEFIEEIIKALHPCNECPSYKYGCENAEYFEDTCKTEKSISWNELRIVLEELKENK